MPVRVDLECGKYLDRVMYKVLAADGTEMAIGV